MVGNLDIALNSQLEQHNKTFLNTHNIFLIDEHHFVLVQALEQTFLVVFSNMLRTFELGTETARQNLLTSMNSS